MSIDVGILGFAHSHVNAYCAQWRSRPELGVRVLAGWDHDAQRAAAAAKQHAIDLCASASDLLGRPDVQAVVIAGETAGHADLVEQAAAAGKAIVLQKPLALTLAEADRIVRAVERAGVPFTIAWQMRVDPQNVQMKQWLDDGLLGRVWMVRRRHGLPTQLWPDFENSWHTDPALNRGMWADDAAHAIDFLLWLLGEPESVSAEIATLGNANIPDDNGVAVFRYGDGGPMAEVSFSATCIAAQNTTEIIGERGTIIQNFGDVPSCNVPRAAGAPGLMCYLHEEGDWRLSDLPTPTNHGQRIAALAQPLAEFLHGRRPPIADVYQSRTALRMVLASHRAAELGQRIPLNEVTSDG